MGKYMRKAKLSDEVAVMEVSQPPGVRTRARTLALQRLQSSVSEPDPSCYLQLRSRRLVKALNLNSGCNKFDCGEGNLRPESEMKCGSMPSSAARVTNSGLGQGDSGSFTRMKEEDGCFGSGVPDETGIDCDLGAEVSFGENNSDFEPRERIARESTPCSLIRDVDIITTPGSSTRQTTISAVDRRNRSVLTGNVPSTAEIEEFFACIEQQQQRQFIDKYNFDVANDVPLTGRYEWVILLPFVPYGLVLSTVRFKSLQILKESKSNYQD